MNLVDRMFLAVAIVLAIPACAICIECAASLLPRWRGPGVGDLSAPRAPLAVLIHAHNDESGMIGTVQSVRQQLRSGDRVIVIAENCTDQTAAAATTAGAQVVEFDDPQRTGKRWALAHGIEYLKTHKAPRMVVLLDGDSIPQPGAINALAAHVNFTDLPVQAISLSAIPTLSAFDLLMKNGPRARGANRIGLPCILTGCAMALPWESIESFAVQDGPFGEAMKLSVDLLLAHRAPRMCDEAVIIDSRQQSPVRAWLTGCGQIPRLLRAAWATKKISKLLLAIDLCVPPISLLVFLLLMGLAVSVYLCHHHQASRVPVELFAGVLIALALFTIVGLAAFKRPRRSTAAVSPGMLAMQRRV
jgi:hypothetical protein